MSSKHDESASKEHRLQEILHAYLQAVDTGDSPSQDEVLRQHPDLADELRAFFADQGKLDRLAQAMRSAGAASSASPAGEKTQSVGGGNGRTSGSLGKVRYFGDYELLEEIARGGMGVVYKARQESLNRTVALKMILAGQLASEADVQRFHTEAEAAANLDHPNIVPIYEVGEHAGQHYFSMKLVEGGSLSAKVPDLATTPRAAVTLLATVARAVHHAHQRGILHRDLKPGNILIDSQGQPHVTDFGLAKRVEGGSDLTRSGAIVGTPSYMPPEQALGQKGISTAADVYSLGAILYELLTGRPPFRADTPLETLMQVIEREPAQPRAVNPVVDRDLDTICLKCLEKEPKKRYGSAEALAEDLERWLHGEPIQARPSTAWERTIKWGKRRPAAAALLAVSIVSMLSLLVLAGFLWRNAEQRAEMVENLQVARNELHDIGQKRQEAENQVAEQQRLVDKKQTEVQRLEQQAREEQRRTDEARAAAQRTRYAADMHSARAALERDNISRLFSLLDRYRPQPDQEDLRGFEWHYFQRLRHGERLSWRAHPELLGPKSHGRNDTLVAISPNGKILATVSLAPDWDQIVLGVKAPQRERKVKLWDLATGKEERALPGPKEAVFSLAFAADGKSLVLVTANRPGKERAQRNMAAQERVAKGLEKPSLQNLNEALLVQTLDLIGEKPSLIEKFDPARLAAPVLLYQATDLNLLNECMLARKGYAVMPRCLAGSSDGKMLAIGGFETSEREPTRGSVLLWDLGGQQEPIALHGHSGFVDALAFAPDGQTLASAGADGTIKLWDMATKQQRATLSGHFLNVAALAFSQDGKTLVSGGGDGSLKVWDVAKLDEQRPPRATFLGHQSYVVTAALTADGKTLVAGDGNGVVKVWDPVLAAQGRVVKVLDTPFPTMAFLPDSQTLAIVEADSAGATITVKHWGVTTGREQASFKLKRPEKVPFFALAALTSDGKTAACSYSDKVGGVVTIKLVDLATAQERQVFQAKSAGRMAFSPDSTTLAVVDTASKVIHLWDIPTGQERRVQWQEARYALVEPLAFTHDGRRLAAASGSAIRMWDVATGKELPGMRTEDHGVQAMAFSPDGTRLATGSILSGQGKGGVKLWDVKSGQEVLALGSSRDSMHSVVFSPDGTRLAVASVDAQSIYSKMAVVVKVWEATPLPVRPIPPAK